MKSPLSLILVIVFIQICNPSMTVTTNYVSHSLLTVQKRGVNLGNALDAPTYEGEWGVTLKEEYFTEIENAGFNLIRIPVRFYSHAETAYPYEIDESFFARVDWALNQSLSRGLTTILDMHHHVELMNDPLNFKERFLSFWEQLANRYQNQSEKLWFELLNEPTHNLSSDLWNQFLSDGLSIVRRTNPQRTVIIGGAPWNSLWGLEELIIPENDSNIILTFHYYEPFEFTHQGASWADGSDAWLGTTWKGTETEKEKIISDFNKAEEWSKGRQLFLGEFGAYRKADEQSRERWTSFIVEESEKRGIHWSYWEFCADFGIWDQDSNSWRLNLLNALLPNSSLLTSSDTPISSSSEVQLTTFEGIFVCVLLQLSLLSFLRRKWKKS